MVTCSVAGAHRRVVGTAKQLAILVNNLDFKIKTGKRECALREEGYVASTDSGALSDHFTWNWAQPSKCQGVSVAGSGAIDLDRGQHKAAISSNGCNDDRELTCAFGNLP